MRRVLLYWIAYVAAATMLVFAVTSTAAAEEYSLCEQGLLAGATEEAAAILSSGEAVVRPSATYDNVDSRTDSSGLTLKVSWDNPKCGEPTTFHLEGSGGSGTYKYLLNAVSLFNSDFPRNDYDAEAVTDSSYHDQNGYAYQDSGDISFTFMASGYYRLDFYITDTGNQWQYMRFFLRVKVSDPAYPTIPEQIQAIAERCIAEGNVSDYDKALWMHDWLIDNMEYDHGMLYCGYEGAFLRGKGTCETYHRAYSKLLAAVGVDSGRVEGNGHVWTAVKIDGQWCHVDATWDDSEQLAGYPDLRHLYFGMNDYVAGLVHSDHADPLPGYEAPSLENHYYLRSGTIKDWVEPYVGAVSSGLARGDYSLTVPIDHAYWASSYKNVLYNLVAYDLQNRAWALCGSQPLEVAVRASYKDDMLQVDRVNDFSIVSDGLPVGAIAVFTGEEQVGVSSNSSQLALSGTIRAVSAGSYTALVRPTAGYAWNDEGDISARAVAWSIERASISAAQVTGLQSSYTETGVALTPRPRVTFNGKVLKEGVDYSLTYANNIKPGTAAVILSGLGNFAGSRTAKFTVVAKSSSVNPPDTFVGASLKWVKSGGAWYLRMSNGSNLKGWQKVGGKWFYLDPTTGAMRAGWQKIGGGWYYLTPGDSGAMRTGWQKIDGSWYYLTPGDSGRMKTGWQKIGGRWYYLTPGDSGRMKTGWQKIGGGWYYLTPGDSGAMKTGWQRIGAKWYYLTPGDSGRMVTGWRTIGGRNYLFDASGVCVNR